jgi:hypothetical protein
MDKIAAARLDGMLIAARGQIAAIADPLRVAAAPERLQDLMLKLGTAMSELLDISWEIHDEDPDLDPEPEARQRAEDIRSGKLRPDDDPWSSADG